MTLRLVTARRSDRSVAAIESSNFPNFFIRHRGGLGEISTIGSDLDRKDAIFQIKSGLVGNSCVSLGFFSLSLLPLRSIEQAISLFWR